MSLDICLRHAEDGEVVFEANITHNLGGMAAAADLYRYLWRAEESGVTCVADLLAPLEKSIALMLEDPERFEQLDAPNGWGTYAQFVPWLQRLLEACKEYPTATVEVSV